MCSSLYYTQYLYILSMKKYNKTSSILPLSDFIKSDGIIWTCTELNLKKNPHCCTIIVIFYKAFKPCLQTMSDSYGFSFSAKNGIKTHYFLIYIS